MYEHQRMTVHILYTDSEFVGTSALIGCHLQTLNQRLSLNFLVMPKATFLLHRDSDDYADDLIQSRNPNANSALDVHLSNLGKHQQRKDCLERKNSEVSPKLGHLATNHHHNPSFPAQLSSRPLCAALASSDR